jgi:hypothetical protein
MKPQNDESVRKLLKSAFPPVCEAGPPRDLWPTVLRRLDERAPRVPWFDWALAALLALLLAVFPHVIPALFYYL